LLSNNAAFDYPRNSGSRKILGLGSGAVYDQKEKWKSSILPRNLYQLELLAKKTTPPIWPSEFGAIDKDKSSRGAALFQQNCASCHSSAASYYGGQLFDPAVIGTDSNRANLFTKPIGKESFACAISAVLSAIKLQAYRDANVSPQEADQMEAGRSPAWRVTGKYASRPLTGIWATAPYLHNNSVLTLYDLLLPAAKRPTAFAVGFREYDPIKIGYAKQNADKDHTFDTSLPGNSNAGHEYAVDLSETDRQALVEYLKFI
jgi:hypothetical protein